MTALNLNLFRVNLCREAGRALEIDITLNYRKIKHFIYSFHTSFWLVKFTPIAT